MMRRSRALVADLAPELAAVAVLVALVAGAILAGAATATETPARISSNVSPVAGAVTAPALEPVADLQPRPAFLQRLPIPCASEDTETPCYWNATTRGNGVGRSYVRQDDGRVAYVPAARLPGLVPDVIAALPPGTSAKVARAVAAMVATDLDRIATGTAPGAVLPRTGA